MEAQIKDKEGLGGKLDAKDRATIEDELKEKKEWMEENMSSATAEDFEDKLAELQAVMSVSVGCTTRWLWDERSDSITSIQPIVSAMYGAGPGDEQQAYGSHDEL
jgi:hypothetical protein